MSERDLERLAPRLGEDGAARVDLDRVAHQVTARLRQAGGPVPVRPIGRWLAMAAGLALLVGASWFTFATDGRPPLAAAPSVVMPGLNDLSVTELNRVLDSLDTVLPARAAVGTTLDDLDTEQLQRLLTMMEG